MKYAKKVKTNKTKTLLSKGELNAANEAFNHATGEVLELNGKRKISFSIFVLSFAVMILGVIPWGDFG